MLTLQRWSSYISSQSLPANRLFRQCLLSSLARTYRVPADRCARLVSMIVLSHPPYYPPSLQGSHQGQLYASLSSSRFLQTASSSSTTGGNLPYWILVGVGVVACVAAYSIFGEKDDGSIVSASVKRQLLKANRALRLGDYGQAEKASHKALSLLMNSEHTEKQAYLEARAVVMDKLANIYLEQNKYKEAEMLFKEAMRVMLYLGVEQNDDAVIEISLKLAKVYHNQQRLEEAETGFAWCVDTARKKWEEDMTKERYALLGMCLQGRAHSRLLLGQHNSAIQDFSETVDIAESVHGANHIQVAVSYNNMASAYDAARNYKRAVSMATRSLELVEQLRANPSQQSEDGQEVVVDKAELDYYGAVFHNNLGTIHLNNGEQDLAAHAYDNAAEAVRKCEDKQLLAQIMNGQKRLKMH